MQNFRGIACHDHREPHHLHGRQPARTARDGERSINLIYLDPPFNSNADYAAPIGAAAVGAAFKDTWTADDVDVARRTGGRAAGAVPLPREREGDPREEHVLVSDLHSRAAAGDAARAEDNGQSALRRYGHSHSLKVLKGLDRGR